jgi:hypothetical protein
VPRKPSTKACDVAGCDKLSRSPRSAYCEMHYARMYQRATLGLREPKATIDHSHGYVLVRAPDHPLCPQGQSYVYEHRKVFYDANGVGPFRCHVCSAPATWDSMHVDHLDDDPRNNELDNLSPACPTCNQWRARAAQAAATRRAKGKFVTAFGEALCISEWARKVGLPVTTLNRRIKDGWDAERALSTPSGPTGRKERAAGVDGGLFAGTLVRSKNRMVPHPENFSRNGNLS